MLVISAGSGVNRLDQEGTLHHLPAERPHVTELDASRRADIVQAASQWVVAIEASEAEPEVVDAAPAE